MQNKTIRMAAKPDKSLPDLGLETIASETKKLFSGTLTPELGAFNLHPHIVFYEGTLFAMWSCHWQDEDSPGQYIRYAFSRDLGKSWSDAYCDDAILFPKMEKPLLNPEVKDKNGNRLPGCRPHDRCGTGNISENTWENDNCGHCHLMLCANGYALADGKLYAIGEAAKGINYPGIGRVAREVRSDGALGPIFWLNERFPDISEITPDVQNADTYNAIGYGGERAKKLAAYLADSRHMPQWDMDPAGWPLEDGKTYRIWKAEFAAEYGESCCEPTYSYRAADGVFVRIWRSRFGIQHAQYSFDNGKSWTKIGDTDFPDTGARTNVGNLPDGRAFLINNPGERRLQMCISLSRDGYLFDKTAVIAKNAEPMKHPGRAKGPGFHYPHSCIAGDKLFVAYSVNKEDINITAIALDELENIRQYV